MVSPKRRKLVNQFSSFNDKNFRVLIEKSFDVIAVVNARGHVLYASPSIVRLYGRGYDEILGVTGLKYVHPADLGRIVKLLSQILLNPKKTISTELRIKHKNGQWRWVVAIATNLLTDKNIGGIVINFHDITDLKLFEARKDEFISIASHELKTPITSLKAYVQILKRQYGQKDEQLGNYLQKIDNQMTRLTGIINELLDVSRIQEGKLELKKELIDIGLLVEEVVDDMRLLSGSHQIVLQVNLHSNIYADKYHVTQVMINLLSNAIRYSNNSSKIIVKCRKKSDEIIISVQDFGRGIAKKNIPKIFERFYQELGESRKNAGLGIGLYISSVFVKQHNGKIWVRSQEGKGSTFLFSLPINSS